jgi:hypothetical protein
LACPAFKGEIHEALGGVTFQVGKRPGEIGRGKEGVEVVIKDNPRVDAQSFLLAAVGQ